MSLRKGAASRCKAARLDSRPVGGYMKIRLPLLGLLLWMILTVAAVGQESATLTGTVTDSTGAAIPGAKIALRSTEHGIDRTTSSNAQGEWALPAVPPGAYDLTVNATGFKKYEARGVILRVAQKARVDIAMQVGAATSEITVEGSTVARVDTQSSEVSGVVTGKEISQLQLNGRNFTQLVT